MFPKKGILTPVATDSQFALQIVTSSQVAYTTAEDFRLTVIGGGCGGQRGQQGGASAGQSIKTFRGVPVGTPIDIVIGAAGTGAINGGANRTAGGTTTVTVKGQTPVVCQGGQTTDAGGTATGGDINITGGVPMFGYFSGTGTSRIGGDGAGTILGMGGRCESTFSDSANKPGVGYGAGGSGGPFNSAGPTTSHSGGDGTQGVCIIENL